MIPALILAAALVLACGVLAWLEWRDERDLWSPVCPECGKIKAPGLPVCQECLLRGAE
jgi:uncharacterized OB-fold protein